MLLRMRFKDGFLCLRKKKEHTWQPTNNKPVEVSDFSQKNEMPSKRACFPFSTPSNPEQMILNVHSPHTGFEKVSTCQNCGLKTKAKCRWKWLWRAQAQIPSVGITEEQSWQGGDFKQSQVQGSAGQKMGSPGRAFSTLI